MTCIHDSDVSQSASTQVKTIQYSLNEASRVHDVTVTLTNHVVANNNTIHRLVSQVVLGFVSFYTCIVVSEITQTRTFRVRETLTL